MLCWLSQQPCFLKWQLNSSSQNTPLTENPGTLHGPLFKHFLNRFDPLLIYSRPIARNFKNADSSVEFTAMAHSSSWVCYGFIKQPIPKSHFLKIFFLKSFSGKALVSTIEDNLRADPPATPRASGTGCIARTPFRIQPLLRVPLCFSPGSNQQSAAAPACSDGCYLLPLLPTRKPG